MTENSIQNKTYKVQALGCRTNQYEAQAFRDQLAALGYRQAADNEEADVCIVNTCTVTESADSSSRHLIRSFVKQNPKAKVFVTGCLTESDPDSLYQIGGINHVVKNSNKEELIQLLHPEIENLPEFSIKNFDAHTRAFVKVQDGCNSFCTYCVIPYVRGRSRSRKIDEILSEVKSLVNSGFQEIVLTGINIGDFDGAPQSGEEPCRLADLVRAVDAIDGVKRIRVSSIDPDEIDDNLADAILNGKNTCKSMHMVLQAGSNLILKRMNRKYTKQIFLETARRLRNQCPDFTFTTDIIVGFPGETDLDFKETLEMIREVQFAKVHMFPYSDRPRTRASLYPNKVPHDIIRHRKQQVLDLSEKTSFELRQRFIGRTMAILTESEDSENPRFLTGHTDNFLPVKIEKGSLAPNRIVLCTLIENHPDALLGKVVSA